MAFNSDTKLPVKTPGKQITTFCVLSSFNKTKNKQTSLMASEDRAPGRSCLFAKTRSVAPASRYF